MVFGFYFKDKFTVSRRLSYNLKETFTTYGIRRTEYSVEPEENNFNVVKFFLLLSPEVKIRPGDIISDGTSKIQIGKISELIDIDGNLCAYRCESV